MYYSITHLFLDYFELWILNMYIGIFPSLHQMGVALSLNRIQIDLSFKHFILMCFISHLQVFSFLPHFVGQFQNSHTITLPLSTSTRMSNCILFLILSKELLLPDLCLFCLPAKLQQMSYVLRMMGQSPREFRWFLGCCFFFLSCRFFSLYDIEVKMVFS